MSAGLFYLSFVDKRLPEGERFVGATIVAGHDDASAFDSARIRGLVPPGCETASVELWTQDEANERITRLVQLPLSARQLLNHLVGPDEVKRYGAHEVPDDIITGFICDEHSS